MHNITNSFLLKVLFYLVILVKISWSLNYCQLPITKTQITNRIHESQEEYINVFNQDYEITKKVNQKKTKIKRKESKKISQKFSGFFKSIANRISLFFQKHRNTRKIMVFTFFAVLILYAFIGKYGNHDVNIISTINQDARVAHSY